MNILERLSSELNIRLPQVEAAVKLIDDGNSRKRKRALPLPASAVSSLSPSL